MKNEATIREWVSECYLWIQCLSWPCTRTLVWWSRLMKCFDVKIRTQTTHMCMHFTSNLSERANWNRLDPFGWHFMSIWRSMNTILLAYSCENQTQCTQTDEQIEGNDSRLMVMYCDRSACYLCRIVAFVMCVSRKFSTYFNVCASSFRVSASAPIFFLHIIPFHSSEHYFFSLCFTVRITCAYLSIH